MAYETVAASSQQITTEISSLFNSQQKATLAAWMYRSATGTRQVVGFSANNTNFFMVEFNSGNDLGAVITYSGYGYDLGNTSTGWIHFAVVFNGTTTGNSNRLKIYADGSEKSLTYTGTVAAQLGSALSTYRIGRREFDGYFSNGRYAEIGMWTEALNASEVASLAKGAIPRRVRPQSLKAYIPLVRNLNNPASGTAVTNSNSATVVEHPRVY